MTIEEKYQIYHVDGKRYYKTDLVDDLQIMDNTIPYRFSCRGNVIYDNSWKNISVKIVELLDSLNKISDQEKLSLKYDWSRVDVFSEEKKSNFSKCGNLYLNTNHTSTHALMSIKFLLKTYGIDYSECELFISRHPSAECEEVRDYYRKQSIDGFIKCLKLKCVDEDKISIIIKNFDVINSYLSKVTQGFTDFFLFEDYTYFLNYKKKTIEYVESRYPGTKKERAVKSALNHLEDYYRNLRFYSRIVDIESAISIKQDIGTEIEYLFKNLNSDVISISKLYARMSMIYDDEMTKLGSINNESDFYVLVSLLFNRSYFFKKPFISLKENSELDNEQLLLSYAYDKTCFKLTELSEYADKMHFKRLASYVDFIDKCSDEYVLIDVETLVKKEVFSIDEYTLEKIEKELKYYINSYGSINTETYNSYEDYPEIKYKWNKYLLVGIVRTYLSSRYKVEHSGGSYKNCEYFISMK